MDKTQNTVQELVVNASSMDDDDSKYELIVELDQISDADNRRLKKNSFKDKIVKYNKSLLQNNFYDKNSEPLSATAIQNNALNSPKQSFVDKIKHRAWSEK